MLVPVLTRKGQLSPFTVQILTKSRLISVGSSLRSRSPGLPSCHCWGSQEPRTQLVLRFPGPPVGSHRLDPLQTATGIRSQRQGWGNGSLSPQGLDPGSGWPWREGSAALQATAPACSLGSPAGPRLNELEGPRVKLGITLHLTATTARLAESPVAFWQLAASGQGPLQQGPVTERDPRGSLIDSFLWEGPIAALTCGWVGPTVAWQKGAGEWPAAMPACWGLASLCSSTNRLLKVWARKYRWVELLSPEIGKGVAVLGQNQGFSFACSVWVV